MTIATHTRALLQVLRHRYGVTDAKPGHGGKHPFIRFTDPRTGERRRLTLGHDVRQGSVNMKHQDLRRLLGPPLARATKDDMRRSLEDMMPEPFNPLPLAEPLTELRRVQSPPRSKPTACRVAMYSSDKSGGVRLRFNIPRSLGVDEWRGVGFKVDSHDTWELWDDPTSRKRWRTGDLIGHLKIDVMDPALPDERFGSSPAEVIEVDGHLFVSCPAQARILISERFSTYRSRSQAPSAVKEVAKAKSDAINQKVSTDLFFGPNYRERMLAVLREVTALERETDRRLVRVKHDDGGRRWEWQSVPIRLEE